MLTSNLTWHLSSLLLRYDKLFNLLRNQFIYRTKTTRYYQGITVAMPHGQPN